MNPLCWFLLAVSLSLTLPTLANAQLPIIEIKPDTDFRSLLGKKVIVTGKVERVATLSQNDQRMFFKEHPDFYAFIYRDRREALGSLDLSVFEGHHLFLAGEIGEFRGKPQIIIDDLRQLGPTAETVALPVGKPWPPAPSAPSSPPAPQ